MEEPGRVRIVDERTVEIEGEGHTLMNPLRWAIARNFTGEEVELCGYNIPHPSDNVSRLTIQFRDEAIQTPQNLAQKMSDGLECIGLIGKKMLGELRKAKEQLAQ
jgi:DNA-directed RNA polymerases I and III subunit RPAC2